ncbi:MAG: hypothetical protein J6A74_06260 [Oscillospiraceae bacterium]|nr:hypothetical protein [Oscillospiraceae bacterium]
MKKTVTLLILIILLVTAVALPVQAAGNGSVAMGSASGKQGETVTLKVTMPKNPGLVTMAIKVSFDTNVLQLTKVTDAGLLKGTALNSSYGSPYKITWADTVAANNTKTGTIASFTFKIKDSAPVGATTVSLSFVDSFDTNYQENSFSASSGKITVTCKSHSFGQWQRTGDSQHQRTCSACGHTEKANHSWDRGSVTKEATCKQTGTKKFVCSGCKAEKTETIKMKDHKYGTYTELNASHHTAVCTVCQTKAKLSHSWKDGKVTKEATCQETGSKTLTCKNCAATKEETVPKAAHSFTPWEIVDENSHTHSCTVCKTEETKAHSFGVELLHDADAHFTGCVDCNFTKDSQPHVPGPEATADTDQICTVCNRVLQIRANHDHQMKEGWQQDAEGHWNSCELCDQKFQFAEHTYENNCAVQCNVCAAERTAPHDPDGKWDGDTQGHWQLCESCGEKVMTGEHIPGEAATTAKPQLCTDCGYELAPVLPHEHFDADHSHICECGEIYEAGKECPICRNARRDWILWVLCGVEAVLLAVSVGFNIHYKRKQKKEDQ